MPILSSMYKIIVNSDCHCLCVIVVSCSLFVISCSLFVISCSCALQTKVHFQARAAEAIAVGHQREYPSLRLAFMEIYRDGGVKGLWRGWQIGTLRVVVGGGAQLTCFSMCKDWVERQHVYLFLVLFFASLRFTPSLLGLSGHSIPSWFFWAFHPLLVCMGFGV